MFLARGGMPLSKVWEAWLQPIAGLMPMQVNVLPMSAGIIQFLQNSKALAIAACCLLLFVQLMAVDPLALMASLQSRL